MRKSLVLALVAASMLLGCGYDNGKEEEDKVLQSQFDAAESAKKEAEKAKDNAEKARETAISEKNQAVIDKNTAENDKANAEKDKEAAEQAKEAVEKERDNLQSQLDALNAVDTEDHYEDFLNFVYTEYMKMIKTKQICLNEKTDVDNLMVMADLTSYVTHDTGSSLASMAKVVKTYASDPETITPVGDNNLDDVKSMISYFKQYSRIWGGAVGAVLETLANLNIAFIDAETLSTINEKLKLDTVHEYKNASDMFDNEDNDGVSLKLKLEVYAGLMSLQANDLVDILNSNTAFKLQNNFEDFIYLLMDSVNWNLTDMTKNFNSKDFIFNPNTETEGYNYFNELGKTSMYSQRRLCIETLSGVSNSIAFSRFIASPDMQLDACILAPNISSALVNMSKLVTTDKADKILYSGDYDAIHASLLEPRYLWFSNASVMPIDIKLGTDEKLISDGKAKGFILETINNVPNPMFTDNLMGDTYIHAFPAEIEESITKQNETSKTNYESDVISRARNIVDLNKTEISTRMNYLKTDAKNTDYAFTHTFLYDIEGVHKCNDNKCRFDFAVVSKKMEDSIANNSKTVNTDEPFKCGGFVYNVNRINGYVVLEKDVTGSTSDVDALSNSCSSNWDCMDSNGVLVGACEEGKCKRTCNSTDDCEKNAICDSHVCRQIENCPAMSFSHLDSSVKSEADKRYKDAKCVKVFSHTPSVSFADALTGDAEIKDSKLNDPLNTGDFTSDNYIFTIPNDSLDRGLSFGMITYATIRFVNLLAAASNNLAKCFRPEALDTTSYSYNGMAGLNSGYKYLSDYNYSFSNETLSSSAVFALCTNGTNDMEYDMMAYAIYQYYVNYKYAGKDEKDNLTPEQAVSKFNNPSLSREQRIEAITKLYHEIELKLRNQKNDEDGTSSDNGESDSSSENGEESGGSNS